MDESKKNRILLVIIIVIMLLVIIIGGVLLQLNKEEKKSSFKLQQLYVSDYKIVPFDRYFLGVNDNKIISVIDRDGKELYLNDTGVRYDGIYMKNDDTSIAYNTYNEKLSVYTIGDKGPTKLFTINDVSEVIPLIYKNNEEYLLGFIQYKDNDTYIYNFENKGLVVLDGITLVGDKVANNVIYTYSRDNIIVKKADKYGSVNIDGKINLECNYDDLINDGISTIFAMNNKYGIMNSNKEVVLQPKYDIVKKIEDGYLVGNDKLSFYDNLLKRIVKNKIRHNIVNYSLRDDSSLYEYNVGNNYVIINNYLETLLDKDYKYHDMYIIKDDKYNVAQETGFNNENVVYSYNKGVLSIYSSSMDKELELKVNKAKVKNVIKVQKGYYYVSLDKGNVLYNKSGKKIINDLGELVYYNDRYLIYHKDNKIKFVDYSNEVLETLDGNDIIVYDSRLIVDGNIYLIKS